MAELSHLLVKSILDGSSPSRPEIEELARFWLDRHTLTPAGQVTQADSAPPITLRGPQLPSRHQIGDEVRANGERGVVRGVTFGLVQQDPEYVRAILAELEIPDSGDYSAAKVMYDVETKKGMRERVWSDYVEAFLPPKLHLVPASNEEGAFHG
ncbi:MAG: hypothetical protein HOQ02_04615 [Lysobacter sp.]|nr:hypothetical protein [Lysobacter sp.]